MKSLGLLYGDTIQYYHKRALPIIEKGWTQEIEWPYRKSRLCLVLRFPFTKPGLVIGLWKGQKEYVFEEEADELLASAIGLRGMELTTKEIEDWDV